MPNKNQPAILTWEDLQAIEFPFNSSFHLQLNQSQLLAIDEVIRLVPGRRLVAFATWEGKSVVAKLFFAAKHAKRHMEKDRAGNEILHANKVPTPALYFQGMSADKRIYVLIFERLNSAKNLELCWHERANMEEAMPDLQSMIVEIATQHVLGLQQHDLHLKNFLLTEKLIYTLDGAGIESVPHILPKQTSINNLALFLSQLGVGMEEYQEKLFYHYAKARGWLVKPGDITELFLAIKKWHKHRWQKFAKKIFRVSTRFARIQTWHFQGMYDRSYAQPEFLQFLADPDFAFNHPTAVMLKNGRSATVIKVRLDERDLVVKRYNLKNAWHRLRRCLRKTRAFTSWRLAQKLSLFGVATAKPVAYIEKKFLGLRGKSYYVTEYVAGEHAGEVFLRYAAQEEKMNRLVERTTMLLKNLSKLDITHGDLKITNMLIDAHEQPVLIDLDGALEHGSAWRLRKAWKKEIQRFLQNFYDQPSVLQKFKTTLI